MLAAYGWAHVLHLPQWLLFTLQKKQLGQMWHSSRGTMQYCSDALLFHGDLSHCMIHSCAPSFCSSHAGLWSSSYHVSLWSDFKWHFDSLSGTPINTEAITLGSRHWLYCTKYYQPEFYCEHSHEFACTVDAPQYCNDPLQSPNCAHNHAVVLWPTPCCCPFGHQQDCQYPV